MSVDGSVPMPRMLFWPGSLASRGFEALLEAAASGGFHYMAISPLMISQLIASGMSPTDMIAVARGSEVTLSHMDGVSSWTPLWHQADPLPHIKARLDFSAEQCLNMAEAVGLQSILVAGAFDRGALPLGVLEDAFGNFCDAAAKRGMRVELEFVPFWGIPDLPVAWEIVRQADRPNGGLLIDTWHLQKGSTDFERDLRLLGTIPAGRIVNVQLADAALTPQADTLYAEGRFRRFAGDGELAIERMVDLVCAKGGGLDWIGPEIFGEAIDSLSSAEAGRRGAASMRSILQRVSGCDRTT
jgi:sugar phosphate isomerase/epimerase